jgi:putative transposase
MVDKPKYNPEIHHRRSIRWQGYNYSQSGAYFITICSQNRECLFGNIEDGKILLNDAGKLVLNFWNDLPNHYENLGLDEVIIMPNHIHGIAVIGMDTVGAIHESPSLNKASFSNELPLHHESSIPNESLNPLIQKRRNMILSKIIGRLKMVSSKHINENRQTHGISVWQRNYYEHIIRNEKSLIDIRNYIINNPINWENDKENPEFMIIEKNKKDSK